MKEKIYDIAIIGGGLAGLSLAILQAKGGKTVVLFEKNCYPFHRVCGEYISLESWDFLESLGVRLSEMNLPIIKKLMVTSPSGREINALLDLGGFGISRYKLDLEMALLAKKLGVEIRENTKVLDIEKSKAGFETILENEIVLSKKAVGSFGKRANLDIEWKRSFISKNRTSLNQYIGVKYHILTDFPLDTIALHNFKDGYCGISAIENGQYCLCYMTTKKNLKDCNSSIEDLEKNILSKNPHLAKIFDNSTKLWKNPEVISQISFEKKEKFFGQIPLVGDASGMIAPLCGNGMSMALHGAFMLNAFLENDNKTIENYQSLWKQSFAQRLWVGRVVQRSFGNTFTTDLMIRILKYMPTLLQKIIKSTHGSKIGA